MGGVEKLDTATVRRYRRRKRVPPRLDVLTHGPGPLASFWCVPGGRRNTGTPWQPIAHDEAFTRRVCVEKHSFVTPV